METPLGLTYRPFFPVLQSFYKQQEQVKQLRQKQVAEEMKTAETRAYSAAVDAFKFHPDRPYVNSIEPYLQTQAAQNIDIAQKVRKGELPPEAVYDHMGRMQKDADAAKRYDVETTTFMNRWKDSGNFNMGYIQQQYATDTIDLTATQELGTVAWLPPSAVDPNRFVNKVITDTDSYNKAAMSEKFIAGLKKTNEEQTSEYDAAGNVISKTTSLPDQFFSKELGNSGQQVLNIGDPGSQQSATLLNRWRGMGPDWNAYIELRSKKEYPEDEDRGLAMQKSLQNTMKESGFIGQKKTETALKPPSESDKTGTTFNSKYIGNSRKAEQEALDAADVLHRVIDLQDRSALSFFKGPNIEKADFDGQGNMVVKLRDNKVVDPYMKAYMERKGVKPDSNNEFTIPLDRENLVEFINFKNSVGSKVDWVGEHVEKAYDKKYPSKPKPATTTPKSKSKIEGF